MPITFSEDENFIGNCMEFVRSVPVKDTFGNVISKYVFSVQKHVRLWLSRIIFSYATK